MVCVFSMDYVYEDLGDVDTYVDSCGDFMTSALTLVVLLELHIIRVY